MNDVRVGSLRDADDCRLAARLLSTGRPLAVLGRSVASIWVDPGSEDAVAAVYRIKGANRLGMPMGIMLGRDELPELIDPQQIAPALRPLFLNGSELAARLSTLVWIRFPLHRTAAAGLPASVVSTTPDGASWGQAWITDEGDAHGVLMARLAENGIRRLAPTSMNNSGEPEIVQVEEAVTFCSRHGISLLMRDPDDARAVQGSYPIIEVNRQGVRLVREGHFPAYLVSCLLGGLPVEMDGYRPAKYPLLHTHSLEAAQALSAFALHDEVQAALNRAASVVPA